VILGGSMNVGVAIVVSTLQAPKDGPRSATPGQVRCFAGSRAAFAQVADPHPDSMSRAAARPGFRPTNDWAGRGKTNAGFMADDGATY